MVWVCVLMDYFLFQFSFSQAITKLKTQIDLLINFNCVVKQLKKKLENKCQFHQSSKLSRTCRYSRGVRHARYSSKPDDATTTEGWYFHDPTKLLLIRRARPWKVSRTERVFQRNLKIIPFFFSVQTNQKHLSVNCPGFPTCIAIRPM
jgi:hypothetical protein